MFHDGVVRRDDDFTVGKVLIHREGGDHVDGLADLDTLDVLAHRINDTGSLVPESGWKLDGLYILVLPPHRFGPINTDRFDYNPHLMRSRRSNWRFNEL